MRRVDALRVGRLMLASIPTPDGQVEAAAEGDGIIYHYDLLMMRRAERQIIIKAKSETAGRSPVQRDNGEQLSFESVKQRIIPHQNVNDQLRALTDERTQERRQFLRKAIVGFPAFADKPRAAINVPAYDKNRGLGFEQRLANGGEILTGINQHGRASSSLNTPNILVGSQNHEVFAQLWALQIDR